VLRLNLIIIVFTLIVSGCKLEKQPEYVDEKTDCSAKIHSRQMKRNLILSGSA
jgi:hypothetical protein